ncbi:SEC-C motif-containing protein [Colwellia chukchiensis]|uniref:SEC-C motif-containing protein n=1 Tax=Colwellia chukchiensis TaxID=641665 RepID=A0A1H7NTJ7_9GAMM|nr:YchJ family protein [Colwellia chukchiensis]SEL26639.1 SEC-C motif-containing protein [Colwellia chukchiensis]
MLCPCGSEQTFAHCCQAIISAEKSANSPLQLMRSRYTAYAMQNADYIYQTYASVSQVAQSISEIKAWAQQTKWLKLSIHHTSDYVQDLIDQRQAQVEFSAFYLHQGDICCLHENSNFIKERGAWRYLDGEVFSNQIITTPKRNALCFCASNKKYKHCCAKNV